ncbi:MAG: DUF1273 family protein [Oscillibacter sp.]|nr:DUF1273 family protein [Oscillibacter sp.]
MRSQTCCFTGHRNIAHGILPALTVELDRTIRTLIADGIQRFETGGARGFDTLAAETVLRLRREFPHIRLILVLPCKNQTRGWRADDVRRYEAVMEQADQVIYTGDEYTTECMRRRNRCLVDHSGVCAAYCTRAFGGTAYTVDYAQRQGVRVVLLEP